MRRPAALRRLVIMTAAAGMLLSVAGCAGRGEHRPEQPAVRAGVRAGVAGAQAGATIDPALVAGVEAALAGAQQAVASADAAAVSDR